MTTYSAEQIVAKAIAEAGSSHFGPAPFGLGLQRTLETFARLPLKPEVREAVHAQLVRDLVNRLQLEQWLADHPEIEAQEIEGPVLVCGLPRTGTTATVGMLALDPRFRFLRAWETVSLVPPPQLAGEATDPRAVAAREAAKHYKSQNLHIHDPDGPMEDLAMLASLTMQAFHGALPMPDDYLRAWMEDDFTGFYALHRRVLKLLQSERPPRLWLLKAPPHLFRLDAFLREYPDAKFVWTHRDPARTIPSNTSIQHVLHQERCLAGSLDKREAGPRWLGFWAEGMRRGLKARDAIGEHRFIDVWNDELVARPVETMAALYGQLGYEFTPERQAAIADYHSRNAPSQRGGHHYTPEEYGLTREAIRAEFGDYIARFRL